MADTGLRYPVSKDGLQFRFSSFFTADSNQSVRHKPITGYKVLRDKPLSLLTDCSFLNLQTHKALRTATWFALEHMPATQADAQQPPAAGYSGHTAVSRLLGQATLLAQRLLHCGGTTTQRRGRCCRAPHATAVAALALDSRRLGTVQCLPLPPVGPCRQALPKAPLSW